MHTVESSLVKLSIAFYFNFSHAIFTSSVLRFMLLPQLLDIITVFVVVFALIVTVLLYLTPLVVHIHRRHLILVLVATLAQRFTIQKTKPHDVCPNLFYSHTIHRTHPTSITFWQKATHSHTMRTF